MAKDSGIVNIHGKEYQTVAYRVKNFRQAHPDFSLLTEIVIRDADCAVMKATIADPSGRVIATGHSEEYRASSTINRTSALENAETSAIGRALAAFGMGGTEFATADEVASAISQQKRITPAAGSLEALSKEDQATAKQIANSIVDLWNSDREFAAYEAYYQANLSNEMILGVWELLGPHSQRPGKEGGVNG
jgi:hypothetical protein